MESAVVWMIVAVAGILVLRWIWRAFRVASLAKTEAMSGCAGCDGCDATAPTLTQARARRPSPAEDES